MNLTESVPNLLCICSEVTNDNMFFKVMDLPKHEIIIFDKGNNHYSCFEKRDSSNRYFVTRKKDNTRYEIVNKFDCSHAVDIKEDQIISLKDREKQVSRTVEARLGGLH